MKASRVAAWGFGLIVGLLALVAGAVAVVVSNEGLGQRVLRLAIEKSGSDLEIGAIQGPLRGPLTLRDVRYRSPAMTATVDSVRLTWLPSRLLLGRVYVQSLVAGGVTVVLADSTVADTTTSPVAREPIRSPLPVVFDQVTIDGVSVDAPNGIAIEEGRLVAGGSLDGYRLEVTARIDAPRIRETTLRIVGRGTLDRVDLHESVIDVLGGRIRPAGSVEWWPVVGWDVAAAVERIRPGLLLEDSTSLPGEVSFHAVSKGQLSAIAGPEGRIAIDSVSGAIRGQTIRGKAEARFAGTVVDDLLAELGWGSVALEARGAVGDTLALGFDLAVGDLSTVSPSVKGALTAQGTVSGPRLLPVTTADFRGTRIVASNAELSTLEGRFHLDLAPEGDNLVHLTGRGRVANRPVDRIRLDLRGPQTRHRLDLAAAGPGDTLRIIVEGGLVERRWSGVFRRLDLADERVGRWRLARPMQLTASAENARVQRFCLLADSVGGSLCAAGEWTGGTSWRADAQLTKVPFGRLSPGGLARFPGGVAAFEGTIGASLEARSSGDHIVATLRASSDTVGFRYRLGTDTTVRRITLDSAVVALEVADSGLGATIGIRLVDDEDQEVADLNGTARIPGYRTGRTLASEPIDVVLKGRIADLALMKPLVGSVDTLAGAVRFDATVAGTVEAPTVTAEATVDSTVVRMSGGGTFRGSLDVSAKGSMNRDRSVEGRVAISQQGMTFTHDRFGTLRRIEVDSGAVVVTAGSDGIRGEALLRTKSDSTAGAATVEAHLALPEYHGPKTPLATQPITMTVRAELPDPNLIEPFLTAIDSLNGTLSLAADVKGKVGQPEATATLRMERLEGVLSSGTVFAGALDGDLTLSVAADSTMRGSFRLAPREMTLRFLEGDARALVRLDSTAVTAEVVPDGLRGALRVNVADSAGQVLGTLSGDARLPGFTRFGAPRPAQPIEATLTGKADDLRFIEAFTAQIDTATGRLSLDAKVGGTLADSRLAGGVELRGVAAGLPAFGILLDKLDLTARGDSAGRVTLDGTVTSGKGTLKLSGRSLIKPTTAEPGTLRIEGSDFEAFNNEEIHAFVSPKLEVRLVGDSIAVKGEVAVPLAAVVLDELPAFAISPSEDVYILDSLFKTPRSRPISAEIRVTLGDTVSFSGFNFAATLGGAITLRQAPNALATGTGTITIKQGRYRAYGQDLTIQNGVARFAGGPVDNPGLAIRATRTAEDSTTAGFLIAGTLKDPEVSLFSDRQISEGQMLSYVVTGKALPDGSGPSGSLVGKALNSLGLKGGNALAGAVGREIGLDDARLETAGDVKDVAFVAGRYLSPNLYVSYGIGLFDPVSTLRLRYVLSNRFTLRAETGKETKADLTVKVESDR